MQNYIFCREKILNARFIKRNKLIVLMCYECKQYLLTKKNKRKTKNIYWYLINKIVNECN